MCGHISPAAQKGLEKPTGKTRLRTNDLSMIFSYLQFLLSVRGDQAIHPSQEDPTAENQSEQEHHKVLSGRTAIKSESNLLVSLRYFPSILQELGVAQNPN